MPYPEGVYVLERSTWDVQTKLMGSHTKEVTMASWSANGRYLCSAGLDKQVFLWDLSTAESLDRYKVLRPPPDVPDHTQPRAHDTHPVE